MAYSADGITWTGIPAGTGAGTSQFYTSTIYGIAYGNNQWVAVGNQGKMAYSADGITWTGIPAGTGEGTSQFGTDNNILGIAYGNNRWVAFGGGNMAYSNAD
jgi:hypothetical protein